MNAQHKGVGLVDGLRAGGAPVLWRRVIEEALPTIERLVPPGSRVLEVGYGDGLLTCYLAQSLGWNVVGLDVSDAVWREATGNVRRLGLEKRIQLHVCAAEETRKHRGSYDAVFIKTVLYSAQDREDYCSWLNWIVSVLRPGGHFVNFETGRANAMTQLYRRLRGRPYADLSLYTSGEERLYDERFEIDYRRYYGRVSQFAAPLQWLYRLTSRVEEALLPPSAAHCFVVSMVARLPDADVDAEPLGEQPSVDQGR